MKHTHVFMAVPCTNLLIRTGQKTVDLKESACVIHEVYAVFLKSRGIYNMKARPQEYRGWELKPRDFFR